eukprot:421414_1
MSHQNSKSTNNKISQILKTRRRLRSISVPKTTFEIKQYQISGLSLQRSRINTHRLRRRDIIKKIKHTNTISSNTSTNTYESSYTKNTKTSTKLLSHQKSKLIKKKKKPFK